ncbi:hypothetical protein EOA32_17215 [Mesorhizobium sp. M1A.F.Ca.ET.072.01.1.1]|uniref:hypothetical protein n=1 Tax=Mesorhizobium sp. M1A.F.Ca.ET.072.01.1.1 TaxID=2496753 RepID=UPI000FD3C59E|nr:hypothetical protein [Mesorhizobium sp. M1A.F.Ca.ET.072.01.1.1]RUW51085.1 hypothetical protein EOA32_17215 [Mesorhizobium sp. M1A.F.Ca.ET.072.01.1.1]TIV04122.1 MAG: hypothetical protein E5W04_05090 [Mesorhizobium sp.]
MSDPASFEDSFDRIRNPDLEPAPSIAVPSFKVWIPPNLRPTEVMGAKASPVIEPLRMGPCYPIYEHRKGPRGPDGPAGQARTEPVAPPAAGPDGTSTVREYDTADFTGTMSTTYVRSLLQQIQANYLNSQYDEVGLQLDWMVRSVGALSSAGDAKYDDYFRTISALISQLRLGLDYYGLPQNYVPLLSVTYYLSEIENLIGHAQAIDDAYRDVFSASTDQQQKMKALGTAQATIESVLALSKNRRDNLRRSTTATQNTIQMMREQLDQLFFELIAADADFQEAVRNQSGGGCSFVDLCMFVASVVAVVYTGGAAAVALAQSAKKIFVDGPKDAAGSPENNTIEAVKYIVRSVEPAGKSIAEFQKAYTTYKKYMEIPDKPDAPKLPDDHAKLLVSRMILISRLSPFSLFRRRSATRPSCIRTSSYAKAEITR